MSDLAAHLVRSGVLTRETASRALAAAQDGDLASAALRLGLAPEPALARALADLYGCPAVDFTKSVVPVTNLDVVTPRFCRQRRVMPVSVGKAELVLAMADPGDYALADELRFVTGRSVLRYAAVPAAMDRVLDGLVREKNRGGLAWRGPSAPALPDPSAAWVGVVHPARKPEATLDLPEITSEMVIVGVADDLANTATPFDAPTPARRQRRDAPDAPDAPGAQGAAGPGASPRDPTATVRLQGVGTGRLVLVADAAAEAREEVAVLAGRLGATVLQAANGRAALDIVRDARPDLVVSDAMLPAMAGFEMCRAVKGDPLLRPTRVILTSAVHRGTVAADAKIAFGADAFLEKPFRPEEVLRVMKLLLLGPAGDPAEQAARADAAKAWKDGARLLQAGRVDEALVRLRDAAEKDDLSAEAHFYLGHALARQGLLFEAASSFARAAELRPDVDASHQVLAMTYEQLGFQKSAREAWARAIETCHEEPRKRAMQSRLMRLLGL
jgi:CheY-like chemotaxis protein